MTVTDIDSAVGTYSVRAEMTAGTTTDNYKDYYFGDHIAVNGTPPPAGIWLQLHSKFGANFDFGSNRYHKIAIINFEDENGRRRYQIILTVQSSTNQYFIENLKWNADRSFGGSVSGNSQNLGTPATVRFGQWDKLKLYIEPNTPGQSDGIIRLWVNDELKMEYTDRPIREDTNYNPNKLILSNYVGGTDTIGEQWWDEFYLGEEDPDGGLPNDPAPRPPVLLPIEN
jgi:hypothetical protein